MKHVWYPAIALLMVAGAVVGFSMPDSCSQVAAPVIGADIDSAAEKSDIVTTLTENSDPAIEQSGESRVTTLAGEPLEMVLDNEEVKNGDAVAIEEGFWSANSVIREIDEVVRPSERPKAG